MMKNERGFTIMELLVVIVIIGVLAAIGVPAYQNMTKKAKDTACEANRRTISTAVGMYYAENGSYPTDITDTQTAGGPLKGYLDNIADFGCPADKTKGYAVNATTGEVTCLNSAFHTPPSP